MSDELHYSDVTKRLDEIVGQVKRKDLSLAQSLDLLNEAIALGNQAVDLVDIPDASSEVKDQVTENIGTDAQESVGEPAGHEADFPPTCDEPAQESTTVSE